MGQEQRMPMFLDLGKTMETVDEIISEIQAHRFLFRMLYGIEKMKRGVVIPNSALDRHSLAGRALFKQALLIMMDQKGIDMQEYDIRSEMSFWGSIYGSRVQIGTTSMYKTYDDSGKWKEYVSVRYSPYVERLPISKWKACTVGFFKTGTMFADTILELAEKIEKSMRKNTAGAG